MPKPLRSEDPNPKDVRFAHFGVLDDGARSKGAAFTSIGINVAIALIILILGAVVKTNPILAKRITELTLPPEPPKQPPPPKIPPPPPPKPLPTPPKVQPPKIKLPEPEKLPEIKPVVVPVPKPVVLAPAPPKAVTPPPAPVKVNLGTKAAAVPNNDAHPTAVRLGQADNPLKPLNGPAVSRVNLGGAGMPGMNSSNTGSGPHATAVSMGNGCPNCSDLNGRDKGSHAVTGVKLGVPGGTGPLNSKNYSNAPVNVAMGVAPVPVSTRPAVQSAVASSAPKVVYKPTPAYTEEAKSMHLEGNVSVRIRVLSSGAVEVLGVTHGLGHGLDQSAVQAIQGTRFRPALDGTGHPVDWEGVVSVNFQLS